MNLLPIFHKTRQTNSCIRHAQKNTVIAPGVINDPAEIENFVPVISYKTKKKFIFILPNCNVAEIQIKASTYSFSKK